MSQPDDDLTRLLHDAVSDVQPRGSYDDIRSRTDKVVPMKSRWILPTLAVAAVMAVVVAGAFWLTGDETPSPSGTPTQGASSPGPTQGSTGGGTSQRAVPVYFVGSSAHGPRLYREFQAQQVCDTDLCLATASAQAAVAGDPADGDYTAPWPQPPAVPHVRVAFDGDVLTIDLPGFFHDRPAAMSQSDAEIAIQQLIYSAQAGLGKGRVPVQLLLDGKHTDTVLGQPASEPLAAGNPDEVEALVQVDTPANGATVSSPFTVTGRAATFEANVVWELTENGKVVKKGFTTAQECCTLAPYSFQVTAPPGTYTLTVHDTDESGQNLPVNQDTKEITVQ
jgi:hypothetical protein